MTACANILSVLLVFLNSRLKNKTSGTDFDGLWSILDDIMLHPDGIWFLEGYIDELKEIANGKSKKKRKC